MNGNPFISCASRPGCPIERLGRSLPAFTNFQHSTDILPQFLQITPRPHGHPMKNPDCRTLLNDLTFASQFSWLSILGCAFPEIVVQTFTRSRPTVNSRFIQWYSIVRYPRRGTARGVIECPGNQRNLTATTKAKDWRRLVSTWAVTSANRIRLTEMKGRFLLNVAVREWVKFSSEVDTEAGSGLTNRKGSCRLRVVSQRR